jgi:hypothetical protein
MMQPDIVKVEAEQRLERIAIAEATPEDIDAAFDKLIQELTTIADLSTSRRKPGIGKGCPWWCPAVNNATTKAKRDYRSYLIAPTNFRWQNYKTAVALEKSTVKKAKKNSWRRAIAATAHKQKDLWKLEKWARLRSWVPPESITIPPLQRYEGANNLQTTHQGKSGLFAERFFPKPQADIQELETAVKLPPKGSHAASQRVTADEIKGILRDVRPWKAPEKDNIATKLLKACGKLLHQILAALIISSFIAAYFPRRFKIAKITVLPKPNKTLEQKSTPEAWRPISLLNTIGKIIEATFAQRITDIAEIKHLLPNGQIGNKRNKLINLAVRMVIEAATKARKSGGVASLL